jgi:DNA-binding winged helix-turn-helix (wHTH) protein/tetratricopeptide (TPR) repeat protein
MKKTPAGAVYEFGPFTVDTGSGELLKHGSRVSLQVQPFSLLVILVERAGKVVTKAEIQERIWDRQTFVDFDAGLRVAVGKLRAVLGDTAADPRYIETIPKQGYRFLGPVVQPPVPAIGSSNGLGNGMVPAPGRDDAQHSSSGHPLLRTRVIAGAVALLAILVIAAFLFLLLSRQTLAGKNTVVLADFSNSTGDPVFDETLRQGMAIELEQSPYLSLLPEERIGQTLRLMEQRPSTRLTPEIAKEVCERTGTAAVLDGSIARMGSQFILGFRATDCRTGKLLDQQQVQVARKEDVLHALTKVASEFRRRAGESIAESTAHDKPLEEATTPSLDALRAYTDGVKALQVNGPYDAIPFFQHAVEIDPDFAAAYVLLGRVQGDIGELDLSAENIAKAYQLRDHASDAEKFFITAQYEIVVTGNMEKANQTCEEWTRIYPREKGPYGFRGGMIYPSLGKFQEGVDESRKFLEFDPDFPIGYSMLAGNYAFLNQLDEAKKTLDKASERGVDSPGFRIQRYDLAFLKGDRAEMARQLALGRKQPGAEDWITDRQAFAFAYVGRLVDARSMLQDATQLAQAKNHRERAAQFQMEAALWEAFFGEPNPARKRAVDALALSKSREVTYGAALVFALAGENVRAETMTDDLQKRFPEDTAVQFSYVPTLRARLALNRGMATKAVEDLQPAIPYELNAPPSSFVGFGALYPVYMRGSAYLAAHQGARAAAEFQKILDHRQIVVSDPLGALTLLQLGRSFAEAGEKEKARAAYTGFLNLWKGADAEIPALRIAKIEFSKLQ